MKKSIECEILKGLRMTQNLSQRKLEIISDVDVSKYESNVCQPGMDCLKRLCIGLKITRSGLFLFSEQVEKGKLSIAQAVEILKDWENNGSIIKMAIDLLIRHCQMNS